MLDPAQVPERLKELEARYPDSDPAMVAEVVRAVLSTMSGDLSANETALLAEVEELAQTVASARAEIAKLRADDITGSHIPSATDELDAIVEHTAVATNIILECCEKLDELGPTLSGEAGQAVQDVTTRVYEACSFQDITGQRITKVVATLQTIERKVAHIIDVFSRDRLIGGKPLGDAPAAAEEAASLMNGPQLPAAAMGQSDIDALLASFD
ncbi:MAG TPA: protein phosphatase CheZ [Acetobacteraceae bacterium]|nr:protein phosphatase CheZ [Acetobacteraceae bacterium]